MSSDQGRATDQGQETEAVERISARRAGPRPSVLLVREWEQQMSSSGCCGRLEGDFLAPQGERCFPERRDIMEAMGPLYRGLRERYGDDVEVNVIDPRNIGTLFTLLARDFRAHRPGWRRALHTLFSYSVTTTIVNGRIVARGDWPTVDEVADALGGPVTAREVARGTA